MTTRPRPVPPALPRAPAARLKLDQPAAGRSAPRGRAFGQWHSIAAGFVIVLLAGLTLFNSLPAYLADVWPEAALRINPQTPAALIALAQQLQLDAADDPPAGAGTAAEGVKAGETAGAASVQSAEAMQKLRQSALFARTALEADPLSAEALRLLGQSTGKGPGDPFTRALMQAASRRSQQEIVAHVWMLQAALQEHDFESATAHADILLRTRPQLTPSVVPVLAAMAERPDASAKLKEMLQANPPWRQAFLQSLSATASDVTLPLDLLLQLRSTPAPTTKQEVKAFLDALVSRKRYDVAYYAWLQFLPPEQLSAVGLLFNGDFGNPPSGYPFDWQVVPSNGADVEVVPGSGAAAPHGLYIEFQNGRVDFSPVTQLVLLAPGNYSIQGHWRGEFVGTRGLEWRLTCANSGAVLGHSDMFLGSPPAGKAFRFAFAVPEQGCEAQIVQLALSARSASERLVEGAVWINDLRITRGDREVSTSGSAP